MLNNSPKPENEPEAHHGPPVVGFFSAPLMRRITSLERIKTDYPYGVLTCDVLMPRGQQVWKNYHHALTLPPLVESANQFDTDAVELAENMIWRTCIFRLYQWRYASLGISVEPYEIARISFMPNTWAEAHGLCHTLVSELNNGPLSETARNIMAICKG